MRAVVISGLLAAFLSTSSPTMNSAALAPESLAAASDGSAAAQTVVGQPASAAVSATRVAPEVHVAADAATSAPDGVSIEPSNASTTTAPAAAGESSPTEATTVGQTPLGLTFLHGERSQLEAHKQLLTLQLDIAVLQRKLLEVEHGAPEASAAPTVRASLPAPTEPAPSVLSRRGFDGRYSAVLQIRGGGELTVQPGDALPHGKVEHIDAQGVTATWYGRRVRLLDAVRDVPGANESSRGVNLALPPLTVSQP